MVVVWPGPCRWFPGLVTDLLIILISYIIEPVFSCLQRHRAYRPFKLLKWQPGKNVQLQRIAYQGLGQGTWSGFTASVPLPAKDELLEPLSLRHGDPHRTFARDEKWQDDQAATKIYPVQHIEGGIAGGDSIVVGTPPATDSPPGTDISSVTAAIVFDEGPSPTH